MHQLSAYNPIDSVRYHTNKRNGGFRLGLDGYQSFIGGSQASVAGLRYGLDYKKIAVYSGFYGTNFINLSKEDTSSYYFGYISTTIEYYLHNSWRWQLCIPAQIGYGTGDYYRTNSLGRAHKSWRIYPALVGISATVRFLRYFGFTASTGLRISVVNGSKFNAPYYSAGLTFFTGTMYKDAKKKLTFLP